MFQMVMDARKEKHPDKSGSISVSLVSSATDLDRNRSVQKVRDKIEALALAELVRLSDKVPLWGHRNNEADTPVGVF